MDRDTPLIHLRTDYFPVLLHYWLQCSQLSLIVCVLNKTIAENQNVGMKIHALQQNFCAEALDKAFFFSCSSYCLRCAVGWVGSFPKPPLHFSLAKSLFLQGFINLWPLKPDPHMTICETFLSLFKFSNLLTFQKVQLCQHWVYPIRLFLKVWLIRNNNEKWWCFTCKVFCFFFK